MKRFAIALAVPLLMLLVLALAWPQSFLRLLAVVDRGPPRLTADETLAKRVANTSDEALRRRPAGTPTAAAITAAPAADRVQFPEAGRLDNEVAIVVAAWTLEAPDLAPNTQGAEAGAWRTSFGSERRTHAGAAARAGFEADVIVLPSVSSAARVRSLFPAEDFFVISSPQLMQLALMERRTGKTASSTGAAIVLRRTSGVRLLQRQRISPRQSSLDQVLSPLPEDLAHGISDGPKPFAIAVAFGEARLWIVAADFSGSCIGPRDCRARDAHREALRGWIAHQAADNHAVLVVARGAGANAVLPFAPSMAVDQTTRGIAKDHDCRLPVSSMAGTATRDPERASLAAAASLWRSPDAHARGGAQGEETRACVLLTQLTLPKPRPLRRELDFAGQHESDSQHDAGPADERPGVPPTGPDFTISFDIEQPPPIERPAPD
ncbi:MAG: hypothetical protein ACFCUN_05230 [Hyphomicrobiaceae bacterium]